MYNQLADYMDTFLNKLLRGFRKVQPVCPVYVNETMVEGT